MDPNMPSEEDDVFEPTSTSKNIATVNPAKEVSSDSDDEIIPLPRRLRPSQQPSQKLSEAQLSPVSQTVKTTVSNLEVMAFTSSNSAREPRTTSGVDPSAEEERGGHAGSSQEQKQTFDPNSMETRLVFYPKSGFSGMTIEEKKRLKDTLVSRARALYLQCMSGNNYKRYYPSFTPPQDEEGPFPRDILEEDEDGVVRRVLFRPESSRAQFEKDVAEGRCNFKLPPNPTPTNLELLTVEYFPEETMPGYSNNVGNVRKAESSSSLDPQPSTSKQAKNPKQQSSEPKEKLSRNNENRQKKSPIPPANLEEANTAFMQAIDDLRNSRLPSPRLHLKMTDFQKRLVAAISAKKISETVDRITNRVKEEKEAEQKAKKEKRMAQAAARKASQLAAQAAIEAGNRKVTRLATETISRVNYSRTLNLIPAAVSMTQKPTRPSFTRAPVTTASGAVDGELMPQAATSSSSLVPDEMKML